MRQLFKRIQNNKLILMVLALMLALLIWGWASSCPDAERPEIAPVAQE